MSERYTVRVLDTPYIVVSDEREEQVEKVAKLVDHSMRALLERNPRASVTMAGIYTAFQFCDEKIKAEEVANNLRVQLQGYLEDMNKLRGELDEQRRRVSSLEQELRSERRG